MPLPPVRVQVANLHTAALQLVDLVLELKCVERVDPSWVSAAWTALEGTPLQRGGRHLARQLLQASAHAESDAHSLPPGAARSYVFRCGIPYILCPISSELRVPVWTVP